MSKTAVVLLNWNGAALLEKFLQQVIDYSHDCDVIVVDNGSTDNSVSFLKEKFSGVKLIELSKNFGFAGGYNEALKQISAEYFILLNTDVEVTPGWIKPVIDFLDSNHGVAACQPKIKSHTDRNLFEHAGGAGGFIDRLGYPFCRGRLFNTLEEDKHQYDSAVEIFWATGACLFIRSNIFFAMQGFDDKFFAHMEEIDLCWRIKRAGYKIYCIPQSTVYHVGGGTLPKRNPHKTYLNFRNNLMMMHKNLPPLRFVRVMVKRLFLDGIAAIKFLFDGDWKDCIAVFNAHVYFYRHFFRRQKIRKELLKKYPSNISNGVVDRNIVWEYFVRKKKYYSELNL